MYIHRKLSFLSVLLCLFAVKAMAQTNFPVYADTTGLGNTAHKIIINPDGSFVALGTLNEYSPYYFNSGKGLSLCKYNNDGSLVWQKNTSYLVSGQYFYASDVVKAADSGYIVLADSAVASGMSINPNFIMLIKFDEAGNRQWSTYFDDSSGSWGFGHDHRIKSMPGTSEYVVSNYYKMYRFDVNGNRVFTNTNPGALHNFVVCAGGQVVVTTSGTSPQLVFADSNFNVISSHPLSPGLLCYDVAKTADGHWLTLGRKVIANNLYIIYLNKLNPDGSQVWEKTYEYNAIPEGMGILEKDNNYYITASNKTCLNSDTPSSCHGVSDAIIVKTDTSGNELARIVENGGLMSGFMVRSNFGMQSVFYGDTLYTMGTFSDIGEYGYFSESPETTAYVIWKNAFEAFIPLQSINSAHQNAISFAPVPANGYLDLTFPKDFCQSVHVVIYNWMGVNVFDVGNLSQANIRLSTWQLPTGVYTLELIGNQVHEVKKFTVVH